MSAIGKIGLPEHPDEGIEFPPMMAVVGATASGKSKWAMELSQWFEGEIVNTDSMQVYRHFDIGTAKPSLADRSSIRHHLIDVADPTDDYSAGRYVTDAREVIAGLTKKIRVPVLCGGTGLYFRALLFGLAKIPPVPPQVRMELEAALAKKGVHAMHAELEKVDSAAASAIHPNNPVRIIRALAVFRATGNPFSSYHREMPFRKNTANVLTVGIRTDRKELYGRIDERVREMLERGWVEEVRRLMGMGYAPGLKPMQSIGYREIARYLKEGGDLSRVAESIATRTRHYAKRQMTWFRKHPDIRWLEPGDLAGLRKEAERFLKIPHCAR